MSLREFWYNYSTEILISSIFVLICIGLLLYLSISKHRKKGFIGSVFVLFILSALNYILIINFDNPTRIELTDNIIINISSIMRLILCNLGILAAYLIIVFAIFRNNKIDKEKITTTNVALMGILVAVASAVMMFSIPIFPPAPFLKLEVSGLIIFMVFIWYDQKSAVIVSLLTNLIHVFMPGSGPVIPFLDEGINFIATMAFMLPSFLFLKKVDNKPNAKKLFILTLAGFLFTTVFMVLYNAFFNLPVVYEMVWPFSRVVLIFGLFNLIKWGAVALTINLLWQKLYILKDVMKQEQKELTN